MLNSFNYRQHSQGFLGQFPRDISGQVLFTEHFSCNFVQVLGLVYSVNLCLMNKSTNPPQHFIFQKTYLAFYFIVDFVDEQTNTPKSTSMFYHPKSLCLSFFKEFFFFFQHFRDAPPLNTVSGLLDLSLFWLLLVTGSLILFVWTFGNKLLVIFHTQVNLFSIAGPVYRSIIEPCFNIIVALFEIAQARHNPTSSNVCKIGLLAS